MDEVRAPGLYGAGLAGDPRVLIVGGGTAGISLAARLRRRAPGLRLTVIEPSEVHLYQPLWTLVGGGLADYAETTRPMLDLIPEGVAWVREAVTQIDPIARRVRTSGGRELEYEALIVCPGVQLAIDEVEGLRDALDEDPRVWTNYSPNYVEKGPPAIAAFRGGRALFTFPRSPIKCGGAPQKIMWITEDTLRAGGRREGAEFHYFAPGQSIFGIDHYRPSFEALVEARDIHTHFGHCLRAVDHRRSCVVVEDLATGETREEAYDLLHVSPPMRPPAFIADAGLADAGGFVEVDKETLQHTRFPEVFASGDACSAPTGKTGAAVRKQAPVIVENLLAQLDGRAPEARYDGYTSCPVVVGRDRVILAEFGYDQRILESFPFDQRKPRRSMYLLKRHMLPLIYWQGMMKGLM